MRTCSGPLSQQARGFAHRAAHAARRYLRQALAPAASETGPLSGLLMDLLRSKQELLAENALLRQQLIVAARRVKKPQFRPSERVLLVALSAMFAHWRQALILVRPETLLRWHRDVFRRWWTWRSKPKAPRQPRLSKDVIGLIRIMALDNRLWGAERIHGELLKLGFCVATSTVQGYISGFRSTPRGQSWSTFLRNQAAAIWSCDLFEVRDVCLRAHYVFVVMHLETRRLLLATSTIEPTSEWLAQHLRNLTPPGLAPKFLMRDHDCKFGRCFDDVARGAGIRVIGTPKRAPKANAHCERAIGSVRRECLDHILILNQRHLQLVLDEYRGYFNTSRPHQGIDQRRPSSFDKPAPGRKPPAGARVVARPVLGGLHHTYQIAA
jgi:putative transposase